MSAQKVRIMPDKTSSNIKIYDRPERKRPSPLVLVIALVVMLLVGLVLYKMVVHPSPLPVKPQVGLASVHWKPV